MDESQTRFALDLISHPKVRVSVIWFPDTDKEDEQWPHGQFGHVRSNVAKVDDCMAQIVRRLQIRGRLDKTYFVVFSDHGTVGGNGFVNRKFDVAREILNPHFRLNTHSRYQELPCFEAPPNQYAVLSDSDGAQEVTLPYGKADSGDLWRPNFLVDLQDYLLADGRRLRALDVFTEFASKGRLSPATLPRKPVDFAVARADAKTVFVQRTAQSQAFITRRQRADGEPEFKYEPVRNYRLGGPRESLTSGDPLRYLDSLPFAEAVSREGSDVSAWLKEFHSGRDWLKVTVGTEYPGCIDAIGRFFYCEDSRKERNLPDVLLFAGRGWVFVPKTALSSRTQETAGARHGMAFAESTRICMFFSGPGIARGRVIEEPHRIVDILPTVLTMMSKDWEGNRLDGVPIDGIWEAK